MKRPRRLISTLQGCMSISFIPCQTTITVCCRKRCFYIFSYDKTLDREHRCILYRNILLYMNPSSELYQSYIREMEQFAMEQLFALRIDSRWR